MFNLSNYQRNANQNYSDVPPHTYKNGYHQNVYRSRMLVSMCRKRYSCTLLVRMQISAVTMQNTWRFLKKLKSQHHLVAPLLSICLEKTKTLFENIYASQCSLQHYLQQPRHGSHPGTHQQVTGLRRYGREGVYVCTYIHTHTHSGILLSHKGQNIAICSNMDGLSIKCLVREKQLL